MYSGGAAGTARVLPLQAAQLTAMMNQCEAMADSGRLPEENMIGTN